jgi:ribosomal protein S18 acetylase RimI-like enzyme
VSFDHRRPRADEAEAMAALHVQCWREAYGPILPAAILDGIDMAQRRSAWEAHLAQADSFVLAAFGEDGPCGFVMARRNTDPGLPGADGQIAALYVLSRHYRQGLGRQLLGAAAGWWRTRGGASLGVNVLAANVRARAFYESLGARQVRTGSYDWGGHALPDAAYIFENLHKLAAGA